MHTTTCMRSNIEQKRTDSSAPPTTDTAAGVTCWRRSAIDSCGDDAYERGGVCNDTDDMEDCEWCACMKDEAGRGASAA